MLSMKGGRGETSSSFTLTQNYLTHSVLPKASFYEFTALNYGFGPHSLIHLSHPALQLIKSGVMHAWCISNMIKH